MVRAARSSDIAAIQRAGPPIPEPEPEPTGDQDRRAEPLGWALREGGGRGDHYRGSDGGHHLGAEHPVLLQDVGVEQLEDRRRGRGDDALWCQFGVINAEGARIAGTAASR